MSHFNALTLKSFFHRDSGIGVGVGVGVVGCKRKVIIVCVIKKSRKLQNKIKKKNPASECVSNPGCSGACGERNRGVCTVSECSTSRPRVLFLGGIFYNEYMEL